MENDIVARLRVLNHHAKKIAENESLHDLYRDAFTRCEDLTLEAASEIERLRQLSGDAGKLREERDEARRMVCSMNETGLRMNESDKKREAERRGWDCFKEAKP